MNTTATIAVLNDMLLYECNNCAYASRWTAKECEGCSYNRAVHTAIELINRTDKKKVVAATSYKLVDDSIISFGRCPVCNEPVTSGRNYCGNCSQKLDWSDMKRGEDND